MTARPSPPPRTSRAHDLLLWGATGFTGQLVAENLARTYGVGGTLRWAIGGRSREKLEKVRDALGSLDPRAHEVPIVVGDNADRASLDAAVREARVVVSTVGPYALYGRELVGACLEGATDYCDLTGEPQFVSDMIGRHHAQARATGTRIVHCCGYDSIPSDLGTLMVQNYVRETRGERCAEVKCFAGASKGGISGGTAASMLHLVEEAARDPRVRRILADPYALDPDRGAPGPDGRDQLGVRWDPDLGAWTGPFVMAAINGRVVRRTNALLGYAYGRDFRYREAMSFRKGPAGWLSAAAVSTAVGAAFAAAAIPPVRALLAKTVLPAPGEGPSKEVREAGYFTMHLVGVVDGNDGAPPARVRGTVRGDGDPGYVATSKMLTESGVCLALDTEKTPRDGGVLTPAASMGMVLVERLRAVGMTFEANDGLAARA